MDEQAIYRTLGIDPNAASKAAEPAQQAQQPEGGTAAEGESAQGGQAATADGQGANERDSAEPAPTEGTDDGQGADNQGQTAPQGRQPKGQKSAEQAERRRREETDKRIQAEVERRVAEERKRMQAEQDAAFESMNLRDTKTGQPIKTYKQYQEWRTRADDERMQRDLRDGKLSQDLIQRMIAKDPTVQEMQRRQREDDNRRRQEQQSEAQKAIDAQLQEINKLDPNVKTVADLTKLPNFPEFRALVGKGLNFVQAYRLTNWDKLMESAGAQKAAAAKQQAITNARGKDHLQPSKAQGTGSQVSITPEELKMFRVLMPNTSEKEIRAYIEKHKTGGKS